MKIDINGLRNELGQIMAGQNVRVLFKVRPVVNQTLNFDLLNYMIKKRKRKLESPAKGLILNLVRAHPYLCSLLKKKKVDIKNIIFVDALFNISGDSRKQSEQAILLQTPFSKTFEDDIFRILNENPDIEFFMIDDIVALQNYWGIERIEIFLEKLSMVLSGMGDPPVIIVADCTKDERILTAAGAICDKVIDVDGLKIMAATITT
jgi:hypothetical protein